jgi:hypothetical protein
MALNSVIVVRQKNMLICPAGPETKNDCAGEDQRKITRPEECSQSFGRKLEGQRLLETSGTNGRITSK